MIETCECRESPAPVKTWVEVWDVGGTHRIGAFWWPASKHEYLRMLTRIGFVARLRSDYRRLAHLGGSVWEVTAERGWVAAPTIRVLRESAGA